MTVSTVTDLAMTSDYDLFTEVGGSGRDIEMACNHEVVSNLVQSRIQSEIDWGLFSNNPQIDSLIIAQKLRGVIRRTYGVINVDLSGFQIDRNARNINYGSLCFTVDCANSRECMVV